MQPHEVGELGMSIGVHWPRLSSEKSTKGGRINKVLFNIMNIDCHHDRRTIGLYCAGTIEKRGRNPEPDIVTWYPMKWELPQINEILEMQAKCYFK
jgi:hypothetical protein